MALTPFIAGRVAMEYLEIVEEGGSGQAVVGDGSQDVGGSSVQQEAAPEAASLAIKAPRAGRRGR